MSGLLSISAHCRFREEVVDIFDQAQEMERRDRESALIRSRSAQDTGGPHWVDGVACCRECGEPIPLRRLAALPGVGLCLACREERENR
jgi:phage/conjugal plasmid C-4 type zinc finger TraR family protein